MSKMRRRIKREDIDTASGSKMPLPSAVDDVERDLTYYIDDRVELMKQIFSILKPKELQAMASECCIGLDLDELQELCLEEVLGISSKRLCAILDGADPPSDTESSSDDSRKKSDQLDIISLDSISSDDDMSAHSQKRNKKKKKHTKCHRKRELEMQKHDKKKKSQIKNQETGTSTKDKVSKDDALAAKKAGMTILELLELQARARAIRAQLALENNLKDESAADVPKDKSSSSSSDSEVEIKEEPHEVVEIESSEEDVKDVLPEQRKKKKDKEIKNSKKYMEPVIPTPEPERDLTIIVPKKQQTQKVKLKRVRTAQPAPVVAQEPSKIEDKNSNPKEKKPIPLQKSNGSDKEKDDNTKIIPNNEINALEKTNNSENKTTTKVTESDVNTKRKYRTHKKKTRKNIDHDELELELSDTEKMDLLENFHPENYDDVTTSDSDSSDTSQDIDLRNVIERAKAKKKPETKSLSKDSNEKSDDMNVGVVSETIKHTPVVAKDVIMTSKVKETQIVTKEMENLSENTDIVDQSVSVNGDIEDSDNIGAKNDSIDKIEEVEEKGETTNGLEEEQRVAEEQEVSAKEQHVSDKEQPTHDNDKEQPTHDNDQGTLDEDKHASGDEQEASEIDKPVSDKEQSVLGDLQCVFDKERNVSDIKNLVADEEQHVLDKEQSISERELRLAEREQRVFEREQSISNKEVGVSSTHSKSSSFGGEKEIADKSDGELSDRSSSEVEMCDKAPEVIAISDEELNRAGKSDEVKLKKKSKKSKEKKHKKKSKKSKKSDFRRGADQNFFNKSGFNSDESTDEELVHRSTRKSLRGANNQKEIITISIDNDTYERTDRNMVSPEIVILRDSTNSVPNPMKIIEDVDNSSIEDSENSVEIYCISDSDEFNQIFEISDDSELSEGNEYTALSKEPTSEEIEAFSIKLEQEIERENSDIVSNALQRPTENISIDDTNEEMENVSWKDRWLESRSVKKVLATSNILNAIRKKNIELKNKLAERKIVSNDNVGSSTEQNTEKSINDIGATENEQFGSETERTNRIKEVTIGSIEHYNMLQGSTRYVDPIREPEIEKVDSSAAMKKDAKQLMKMYKRLLRVNKKKHKGKDKEKKKENKKSKKKKRGDILTAVSVENPITSGTADANLSVTEEQNISNIGEEKLGDKHGNILAAVSVGNRSMDNDSVQETVDENTLTCVTEKQNMHNISEDKLSDEDGNILTAVSVDNRSMSADSVPETVDDNTLTSLNEKPNGKTML